MAISSPSVPETNNHGKLGSLGNVKGESGLALAAKAIPARLALDRESCCEIQTPVSIEVNARLQVEHPITKEVTGLDIVSLQLFVAAGGSLHRLSQVRQHGHAIECRLYAEDPQKNFFPEHGKIHLWRPADGFKAPGCDVRYETAIQTGSEISISFDSLIAKVVVWAPTRALAIERMVQVLAHTACIGVKTNQLFLQRCLLNRAFHESTYTTSFIPSQLEGLIRPPEPADLTVFSIIPCLAVRKIADQVGPVASKHQRPFRRIRKQFRNQPFDLVNVHCDIITAADGAPQETSLMCIWDHPTRDALVHADVVYLTPVPNQQSPAVTNQYNALSNSLRGAIAMSASSYRLQVDSWHPAGDVGSPECWGTSTMEVSINGSKTLVHIAMPSICTHAIRGLVDSPQRVFCHFPSLATYVEYQRDTLLSFSENLCSVEGSQSDAERRMVKAPMPCKVLSIDRNNGDEVKSGEAVMVIESMKMEVTITVSTSGKFQTDWKKGDAVEEGKVFCSVI
ncbi:uncharacterized protein BDW43DRAFT_316273 [Aspergillus alliaceus]|uniref:uncharacterized protein n=1 Tax=Petromyces alliaceus TaxID=209559 RepID=UPI0012A5320F|nr:uncharacterized protein BDW43DRAFT_316273 [Aspergillus alliaceus]KAB8228071.1 hypothetical protein BDW43DRAFT_316273 [Aspergillus alliaceus]